MCIFREFVVKRGFGIQNGNLVVLDRKGGGILVLIGIKRKVKKLIVVCIKAYIYIYYKCGI